MVCSNSAGRDPRPERTRVPDEPTPTPPADVDELPSDVYPIVPDELIPRPVQQARLPRQPWWKVLLAVVAGLMVVAIVATGMLALFGSYGNANKAEVELAYLVARAEIARDILALQGLVPAATAQAVPESRWTQLGSVAKPTTSWGTPSWQGDTLVVPFKYSGETRTLTVEPQGQDPAVVTILVSVPSGGEILGYVRTVREGSGYKALAIQLGGQTISFAPADADATFGH
jgi:hypothetical protein